MRKVAIETITLYTPLPDEDENGRAQWRRIVLTGVAAFINDGAVQYPARTLEGSDKAVFYIFDRVSADGKAYLVEDAYDALADKSAHWTVHADGREWVAPGEPDSPTPPKQDRAYRPMSITDNQKGSPRMHHLKIICR